MKRVLLIVGAVALALVALPATAGAGAPTGTGTVTVVHDATYDFPDAPFVVTLCVDGEVVDGSFEVTDIIGPLSLPAGSYDVAVTVGADAGCAEPDLTATLPVAAGDDITAAAIWTSQTEGPGLVVWPNDSTCTDGARVTVRHGAFTQGPVDVYAIVGGEPVPLVTDLGEGDQDAAEVPAGITADSVIVTAAGDETPLITVPGPLTLTAGMNYVAYAAGGADGSAGVWLDPIEVGTCTQPTTPTTPTTAAPAPAAQAAAATPRFTG